MIRTFTSVLDEAFDPYSGASNEIVVLVNEQKVKWNVTPLVLILAAAARNCLLVAESYQWRGVNFEISIDV